MELRPLKTESAPTARQTNETAPDRLPDLREDFMIPSIMPFTGSDSVNRAALRFFLGGQREPWLPIAAPENAGSHILAHRGAVFEAVAGTAAGEPDVIELPVADDSQIAGAGVFALGDAGLG